MSVRSPELLPRAECGIHIAARKLRKSRERDELDLREVVLRAVLDRPLEKSLRLCTVPEHDGITQRDQRVGLVQRVADLLRERVLLGVQLERFGDVALRQRDFA